MKKILFAFFLSVLIIIVSSINHSVISYSSGAPTGSTNAPGETTCAANNLCHIAVPNIGTGSTILTIDQDISNGYVPGFTYLVMPFLNQSGTTKTGFQTVALLSNGQGAGTVTIFNVKTQVNTADGKDYVTHTNAGSLNANLHDWMYEWTAPPQGSGTVTIYGAFLGTNENGLASGDSIYTDSLVISENTTGVVEKSQENVFTVLPVVSDGMITVSLESSGKFFAEICVYDIFGNTILKKSFYVITGENKKFLDLKNFCNGMYIIFLSGHGSKKIIKN